MIFIPMQNQNLLRKVNLSLLFAITCYLEQNFTDEKCSTAKRGPLRDDDCYWDYAKARCAWAEYCEYRLKLFLCCNYKIAYFFFIIS